MGEAAFITAGFTLCCFKSTPGFAETSYFAAARLPKEKKDESTVGAGLQYFQAMTKCFTSSQYQHVVVADATMPLVDDGEDTGTAPSLALEFVRSRHSWGKWFHR